QREKAGHEKRIKQVESSNTWKLGNIVNPISSFWNKLFNRKDREKLAQLEAQIIAQTAKIEQLEEKLTPLQYVDQKLTKHAINQEVRSLKDKGELLTNLNHMVDQKNKIDANYREALIYAARLYMNEDEATRNAIYEDIFKGLATEEIPEFMIRAGLSDSPISLGHTSSFRASLSKRMRQQQLIGSLPEWHLDDKQTAYDFVEQFTIKVPELDKTVYTIDQIPNRESVVIKPIDAAGARGVYLVHEENYIFDVRHAQVLTSIQALKEAMKEDL